MGTLAVLTTPFIPVLYRDAYTDVKRSSKQLSVWFFVNKFSFL